ncbi:biopolymer transporter ExbD [Microvirga sp. W0021]|uniref:Biopolymer transporter ExbD n=1 Tax=Hohaiivirga grylli TaxID=3133970 RepID=A0ABV0BNK0_9HYPH
MSVNFGSVGGGRRSRRGRRGGGAINEINMTPFIDVMLVLLIIFMVSAPLLTSGVPVDLPKGGTTPLNADAKPLVVSLKEGGKIFVGDDEIQDETLLDKLAQSSKNGFEERIFIRADKKLDYGRVAQIMAKVTGGGYSKVGLVTATEQ